MKIVRCSDPVVAVFQIKNEEADVVLGKAQYDGGEMQLLWLRKRDDLDKLIKGLIDNGLQIFRYECIHSRVYHVSIQSDWPIDETGILQILGANKAEIRAIENLVTFD